MWPVRFPTELPIITTEGVVRIPQSLQVIILLIATPPTVTHRNLFFYVTQTEHPSFVGEDKTSP